MNINVAMPKGSATKLIRNDSESNSLEVVDLEDDLVTFQVRVGWKTLLLLSAYFVNLSLNLFGVIPFPTW
jgi:hypothetical protein